jgi:hypothetical protein
MKNLFTAATSGLGNYFTMRRPIHNFTLSLGIICLICLLFANCTKENMNTAVSDVQRTNTNTMHSDANVVNSYAGLPAQTTWELQQARAATARYRDIKNAIKDGYTDIMVDVENMGHHFMKTTIVDATFDMRQPEILVYNKNEDGSQELVAAEYAIPLNLSPDVAPEGFTGSGDVWDHNTGFGLWLLHAWVWHHNPDGVFNPTNPLVHLH